MNQDEKTFRLDEVERTQDALRDNIDESVRLIERTQALLDRSREDELERSGR